jgi:hypothetical protein
LPSAIRFVFDTPIKKLIAFLVKKYSTKYPNMPLYFGFPVTCQEAFRLFSLDFEQVKCDIMQKHKLTENMYMDCYFVDHANNFLHLCAFQMRMVTLPLH